MLCITQVLGWPNEHSGAFKKKGKQTVEMRGEVRMFPRESFLFWVVGGFLHIVYFLFVDKNEGGEKA